jgi:hypothetical protein
MQKISKVCLLARREKVNSMEDLYYLYRIEELIYNIKFGKARKKFAKVKVKIEK